MRSIELSTEQIYNTSPWDPKCLFPCSWDLLANTYDRILIGLYPTTCPETVKIDLRSYNLQYKNVTLGIAGTTRVPRTQMPILQNRDVAFVCICIGIHLIYRYYRRIAFPLPPGPRRWPVVGNAFSFPLTYTHIFYKNLGERLGEYNESSSEQI